LNKDGDLHSIFNYQKKDFLRVNGNRVPSYLRIAKKKI